MAILCMHTAHCEFQYTCELLFIDRSLCVGQNLADGSQAYFHGQKATVSLRLWVVLAPATQLCYNPN